MFLVRYLAIYIECQKSHVAFTCNYHLWHVWDRMADIQCIFINLHVIMLFYTCMSRMVDSDIAVNDHDNSTYKKCSLIKNARHWYCTYTLNYIIYII